MELVLPYPPTVNTYYRTVQGKMLISKRGRQYREEVQIAALGQPQLDGRLFLIIEAWMPDRRRRDVDNICKAVLDSLQHAGLYEDDSQIDRLLVERCGIEAPGRVVIYLTEIPTPQE